jgi:hypothetical protein
MSAVPENLAHILGGIKQEGQNLGQTLEPSSKPNKNYAPPKKHENLFDTFQEASTDLFNKVMALAAHPPENPLLLVTTPGTGKTYAATKLAETLASLGKVVVMSLPTRDMVWQVRDRIKSGVHNIKKVINMEGRHGGYQREMYNTDGEKITIDVTPSCSQYENIVRARERGYPALRYVCMKCPLCPHYRDSDGVKTNNKDVCRYFKNVLEAAGISKEKDKQDESGEGQIVLMTHHMMANVVCEGRFVTPDWAVVDEDPVNALRETFSWSAKELRREVCVAELALFRKLLHETMRVAAVFHHAASYPLGSKAKNIRESCKNGKMLADTLYQYMKFNTVELWGTGLARVMKQAANNLGLDLEKVLEDASLAENGVARGEFFSMPESRFEKLPHHKEPEVATALLDVLHDAQDKDDKAYKVSLRWNLDNGWNLHWDYVRKIDFGGPLMFLDAYGEPKIIESYCGREVDKVSVNCKVRDNVYFRQYLIKTTRKVMDNEDLRNKLFDNYVVRDLQRHRGHKVLVYLQKRYKDWFLEKVKQSKLEFDDLKIKWFWMDRGDDSYQDFDAVLHIGTPNPNIVAERHFANSLFSGDAPLSWDVDEYKVPKDERVRIHQLARRENELKQNIHRLRLSKPRDDAQEVIVYSDMRFDAAYELPGANIIRSKKPGPVADEVWNSIISIYEEIGCWTDVLAGFIFLDDQFEKWWDNGGEAAATQCCITYDELKERIQKIKEQGYYEWLKKAAISKAYRVEEKVYDYRGKPVRYYGDKKNLFKLLEYLRRSTGGPNAVKIPAKSPLCDDNSKFDGRPDIDQVKYWEVMDPIYNEAYEKWDPLVPADAKKIGEYVCKALEPIESKDYFWYMLPEYKEKALFLVEHKLAQKRQKMEEEARAAALEKIKKRSRGDNILEFRAPHTPEKVELTNAEYYEVLESVLLWNHVWSFEGEKREYEIERHIAAKKPSIMEGAMMIAKVHEEALGASVGDESVDADTDIDNDQQEPESNVIEVDDWLSMSFADNGEAKPLYEMLVEQEEPSYSVHLTTDIEEQKHGKWKPEDGWVWKPEEGGG